MSKQSAGGKARAAALSREQRREIASNAAKRRWRGDPGKYLAYVIGPNTGPQKIGIAVAPDLRAESLQPGNPQRLRVALELDTGEHHAASVEVRAHWILRDRRLAGEWFDVTAEEACAALNQALTDVKNGLAPDQRPERSRISSVHSVRLPNTIWAELDAEAERRGTNPNKLFVDLMREGLNEASTTPPSTPGPRPKPNTEASPKPAFKSRLKGEWKAP